MKDPYEVLGLPRTATMDEVTAAYRKMAKLHHPDLNPGDKNAQQKMAAVNVAYEEIKSGRANYTDYSHPQPRSGGTSGGYGNSYGGYGGYNPFEDFFRGAYSQQNTQQQAQRGDSFDPVRSYINAMRYREALFALSQIRERDAQWYYLSAVANYSSGNQVTAMQHIDQAIAMDPGRAEYQNVRQQMQGGTNAYAQRSRGFGIPNVGGISPLCMGLCLARLCCRC